MRTTVTLDDDLAKALRRQAAESGRSFKAVLHEAVRKGLGGPVKRKRFRQRTAALGGAMPGVKLDKALALADRLEDDEIVRKLALRK